MKKEDFVKLGADEETAKKYAKASEDELKEYVTKSDYNQLIKEKKIVDEEVKNRDKQLEELKKSQGDIEGLREEIETLQKKNKESEKVHASEMMKLKREAIDSKLLSEAKAKNETATKALFDSIDDAVDLDTYKIKRQEQLKSLQKSEDTAFLFSTKDKPKFKGANPAESGDKNTSETADIAKMNYTELCAYLDNDPNTNLEQ